MMVDKENNSKNFDESNRLFCWLGYDISHPFPIVNLPFGVGININNNNTSCYSRIADFCINLSILEKEYYLNDEYTFDGNTFNQTNLNKFMNLGKKVWIQVRQKLYDYFHNKKFEITVD